MNEQTWTPTEFVAAMNQTLEYAYPMTMITGEVASYKVNQGKWVFFDIKDEETSVPCFMSIWSLRQPLEDGMKVVLKGVPKVTKWGKFSFTVSAVQPVGKKISADHYTAILLISQQGEINLLYLDAFHLRTLLCAFALWQFDA